MMIIIKRFSETLEPTLFEEYSEPFVNRFCEFWSFVIQIFHKIELVII